MGEGQPLIILHGLFGMLDNWQTLGKKWAEKYQVILVDQRNHGHSEHDKHFNYQVMMEDLEELTDDLFLDDINILGHSMGGKVAMKFAQTYPALVNKLIVADIGPKLYPVHHQQIIDGLFSIDFSAVSSRKEVEAQLKNYIPEPGTIQFFLKNLYWKEKGVLNWRFGLDEISSNINNVGEDLYAGNFDKDTLFIRGGNSNYILDEDNPAIKQSFPKSVIETIPNTGHWLHAENPEMFYQLVSAFLDD